MLTDCRRTNTPEYQDEAIAPEAQCSLAPRFSAGKAQIKSRSPVGTARDNNLSAKR
jgi:hypothetical protein